MGMAAGPERDKLFAQDLQGLTLVKAVGLAETARCARLAAAAPAAVGGAGVAGAVYGSTNNDGEVFSISKNQKCSVCGYNNHKSNQCRFKKYKCKKCNQKGHLSRMCSGNSSVHYVEKGTVESGDDGESNLFNIKCRKSGPMTEFVTVNGTCLEFQIDSGSAVNVISETTYKTYFWEVPLSSTNKRLYNYTGGEISTQGYIQLEVAHGGFAFTCILCCTRWGPASSRQRIYS